MSMAKPRRWHLPAVLPETCVRKRLYPKRKDAERFLQVYIKLLRGQGKDATGLSVYPCIWDKHFHVGHRPKACYKRKRNRGVIKHVSTTT
jgi:hypothetical protein